jgi:APA family basic amino acid/polyamine antiporter
MNLPAVVLVVLMTVVLALGIRASAIANRALVVGKLAIIVVIVGFGFLYLNPANWHPFIPPNGGSFGRFGWSGILQGAAAVFFAFIGFDAVTIASQEARSPQRDLPIGILGSLAICTTLYVLMALVMTGLTRFPDLNVPHPLVVAMETVDPNFRWVGPLINVAIVFGLASVGLVLLMGQPRLIHAMSRDGLLPRSFGRVDPRVRIPFGATIATGVVAALVAGVFPMGLILEAVSVATLIAFVGVCVAVMVLRYREPTVRRPFRAPLVPLVPVLGIVFSLGTLLGIPAESWTPMAVWFAIGLVVYGALRMRRTENRREVIVRVE